MTQQHKWVPGKSGRLRLYACIYGLVILAWYATSAARVSAPGFPIGGPGDFTSFLAAGQIVASGDAHRLYDLWLQLETQRALLAPYGLDSQNAFLPYAYPPFFALLFVPIAYLQLSWAYHLWNVFNLGLLFASVWLLWRRREAAAIKDYLLASLLALSFAPALAAFYNGQSSFVLLFATTLVVLALKSGRERLAGAALAIGLVKPQLILLILAVLLYRRAWRMVLAFALAGLGLLLVSLAVVGREGLESWATVLRSGSAWDGMPGMNPALMPNLRGTVFRLGELYGRWSGAKVSIPVLSAVVISLTTAVFVLTIRTWQVFSDRTLPRFELLVTFALAGTLLVSPHLYIQDLTLLIVGALLLAWGAPPRNGPAWPLLSVGAGHVALFTALFLLSAPARAQLAALLLVAFMVVSYIGLRWANSKRTDNS